MDIDNSIVSRVMEAKGNSPAVDKLIGDYMPYIKSETKKIAGNLSPEDFEDAVSVAMIGFHEAVEHYDSEKGTFFSFASLIMKNRVISFIRKELRHMGISSINAPIASGEDELTLEDTIRDEHDEYDELGMRDATRQEIEELSQQLVRYGLTLSDVASNCPKQRRTFESCRKVIRYARENPHIIEKLLENGKLPIKLLSEEVNVEKKTIERHRKYIMAVMIIYSNGYEIIRGHLKQVFSTGKVAMTK